MSNSSPKKQPAPAALLRDVSLYFRDFSVCALNSVSLEINRGEIFGLIGPAGAGKSSALKILAGRIRPTYGSARVFGGSPRRGRVKARLGYFAGNSPEAADDGLFQFMKKFLPRGRTASLAQVLAKKPDLIILDEPFFGLDTAGHRDMQALLLSLRREGRTIVLSGESLIEAREICDRVALCYGGKVEAVGTIQELLASPKAVRFTAPVIPPATLDRVMKIIREDLGAENTPPPAAAPPKTETAPPASITNKILLPLVKNAPPSQE